VEQIAGLIAQGAFEIVNRNGEIKILVESRLWSRRNSFRGSSDAHYLASFIEKATAAASGRYGSGELNETFASDLLNTYPGLIFALL